MWNWFESVHRLRQCYKCIAIFWCHAMHMDFACTLSVLPSLSLPNAHHPCDIVTVLHVVLSGNPDHHKRERAMQLLQVLHRYCAVKWSCVGHRSLSYRILAVICSRNVSSIDTPGRSTAHPSSIFELGVHKETWQLGGLLLKEGVFPWGEGEQLHEFSGTQWSWPSCKSNQSAHTSVYLCGMELHSVCA